MRQRNNGNGHGGWGKAGGGRPTISRAPLAPITSPCAGSPEEQAQRAELRERVLAVLRSLPEEYRLPLTLRYLAGADYETIGTQLGLSNGSLRGLLHRGLKMLRARLPEFGADD